MKPAPEKNVPAPGGQSPNRPPGTGKTECPISKEGFSMRLMSKDADSVNSRSVAQLGQDEAAHAASIVAHRFGLSLPAVRLVCQLAHISGGGA